MAKDRKSRSITHRRQGRDGDLNRPVYQREIRVLDSYEANRQPLGARLEWLRWQGYGNAECYLGHDRSQKDAVSAILRGPHPLGRLLRHHRAQPGQGSRSEASSPAAGSFPRSGLTPSPARPVSMLLASTIRSTMRPATSARPRTRLVKPSPMPPARCASPYRKRQRRQIYTAPANRCVV